MAELIVALDVQAPVEKGQKLGTIRLQFGDQTLGEFMLTSPESVAALTFSVVLRRLLGVFAK